mmetsp:Transcript_23791/g.35523  ORF Transcript_23791/g.35523 Transcript_23791/m.35523 type:complete len:85 (+) Transcript_23791:244-498(+)
MCPLFLTVKPTTVKKSCKTLLFFRTKCGDFPRCSDISNEATLWQIRSLNTCEQHFIPTITDLRPKTKVSGIFQILADSKPPMLR